MRHLDLKSLQCRGRLELVKWPLSSFKARQRNSSQKLPNVWIMRLTSQIIQLFQDNIYNIACWSSPCLPLTKLISPWGRKNLWRCTWVISSSYSCPQLVVPYKEELFSRPFLGESRLWLVFQYHMSTENALGCMFFPLAAFFSYASSFTLHPRQSVGKS